MTPSPSSSTPPAPAPRSGPGGRLWRWTKRLLVLAAVAGVLLVLVCAGVYAYFNQGLPSAEALRTYALPQVTKVRCADGSVCAEYFLPQGRRTVVNIEDLPPHVRNAFLAAEDADFYKHAGLDFFGMTRAAVKNLIPGSRKSGASTLTQQVVKNMLLTPERSLSRKIREWILTPRVEQALTKDQILSLYINQVYYGQGRSGIEEAALYYFGKHAEKLSLGEAAVLAGTVQSPNRINPERNIVKAKQRQTYVLKQMATHGFAPQAEVDKALEKPIVLAPRPPTEQGLYYAEEIRRTLVARYGEEAVLSGGLRVDIAMDPKLQAVADDSVRKGLEAVDRRQGYRGPVGTIDLARFERLKPLLAKQVEEAGRRQKEGASVADLTSLAQTEEPPPAVAGAPVAPTPTEEEEDATLSPDEKLAQGVALAPLVEGLRVAGVVTQVDDTAKKARVDLVGRMAEIPFASVTWARLKGKSAPTKMSQVMKPGDIVHVRVLRVTPAPALLDATLDQVPLVQGGLVVIRPTDRHVVALVGGYDFTRSPYNRATQARRQPGSSFKPFIYGAALGSGRFTPITTVNDAPEAIRDPYTGKTWKPQNYDRTFEGPMTLRTALTKSKNTVSVRIIEAITPAAAIDFANRAGIRSPLPENLTLALGTGEVSMLEAANAYATLQANGRYAEPLMLLKVMNAQGKVLEEHQPAFEEKLPPAVAFLTTSLMRSVVEEGTARAVTELNRPAAGKTGTANESRDTWFSGYTADWVASAWVGFDDHSPLGSSETGGRAPLPIWLEFMRAAHQGLPSREFDVPPGVVQVRIDPATGLLAGNSVPGRLESFLEGTQPTAEAPPPGHASETDFFLQEGSRGL
ncbi:Multimodular transpeptidase-transglycosylase [Cystobacter fuscus DSM 2262]|uniref:Penicillin-binding protein 1A n=1 Tax=Cystobacter fuscus (strain ATCC 25194 / DSM 2262 / NBRC 100088 / M29) TaxID=1242864 RepID=S9PJJ4_CYSF2|nr:PBP1A family penicillin-binding protein [Cystobacter fuscus]EPX62577.1 Multimodular transpeptidase-transglycosylase [Cystobacter fuscus DSM 2262]